MKMAITTTAAFVTLASVGTPSTVPAEARISPRRNSPTTIPRITITIALISVGMNEIMMREHFVDALEPEGGRREQDHDQHHQPEQQLADGVRGVESRTGAIDRFPQATLLGHAVEVELQEGAIDPSLDGACHEVARRRRSGRHPAAPEDDPELGSHQCAGDRQGAFTSMTSSTSLPNCSPAARSPVGRTPSARGKTRIDERAEVPIVATGNHLGEFPAVPIVEPSRRPLEPEESAQVELDRRDRSSPRRSPADRPGRRARRERGQVAWPTESTTTSAPCPRSAT